MSKHKNCEYEISERYIPSYFGDSFRLSDHRDGYRTAEINPVETDIILGINELHNMDAVWAAIKAQYGISDTEQEAEELFHSYVNNLVSRNILIPGCKRQSILGEIG